MLPSAYRAIVAGIALGLAANLSAAEFDGFLEPYRVIDLASTDVSTIAEVLVKKGDAVVTGQPLVRLDTRVLAGALATADQRRAGKGRIRAAQASVKLRQSHVNKLRPLISAGHAQAAEFADAQAELEVAQANLQSALEDKQIAQLEYDRITIEVERRTIRSPIDALVIVIEKEVGEAVFPADPKLLTIAQLNPLKLAVQIPEPALASFVLGKSVEMQCDDLGTSLKSTVDYIAPVINPESGTTLVELLIANDDATYRSGLHCRIDL